MLTLLNLCPSLVIIVNVHWQLVKCCVQQSCWGEFVFGLEDIWTLATELWLLMLPNSFQRHTPGAESHPFVKMPPLICTEGFTSFSPLRRLMQTRRVCFHLPQKVCRVISKSRGQTSWPPRGGIPDLFFPPTLMHAITFQDY